MQAGFERAAEAAPSQGDSTEELQGALRYGVYMHVFPWDVVRDHRDAVTALMASDISTTASGSPTASCAAC